MLRPPPPPPPPPKKVFSTLESLVPSKKKTLNSRNNSSAPDFQPMNSSLISARVSTSNDRGLRPYWNGQVTEWSRKLWLPIVTALQVHLRPHPACALPSHYKTRGSLQ